MTIERKYTVFFQIDNDGVQVDTFFTSPMTLDDARRSYRDHDHITDTIVADKDSRVPLSDAEVLQIAEDYGLTLVESASSHDTGYAFIVSDELSLDESVYGALHHALDNMGVELEPSDDYAY